MDDQLKEFERDLRERALTYSFLARMLSDEEVGVDFLRQLAAEVPSTGTELDAFAASLSAADLDAVRCELAADHSSCLLGMSAHPVSPFESVHTSDKQLMMQDSRDEVVHAYAQSGFAKAGEYHVPEDHVSLELDFMAGLGMRAANAVAEVLGGSLDDADAAARIADAERDTNAQLDFLEKHLLVWVPGFCDELEKRAATPLYRGAAQMLRAFLDQERAYLEQLNAAQTAGAPAAE